MRKVPGKSERGSNGEKAEAELEGRFVREGKSLRMKRRGSASSIRDELPLPMEGKLPTKESAVPAKDEKNENVSIPSLIKAINALGKALGIQKIPDTIQEELVTLIVEVPPGKREAIFEVLMDRFREDLSEALHKERDGPIKRIPGSSQRNPTPTLKEYDQTGRKAEGRRSVNLSPLDSPSGSTFEE